MTAFDASWSLLKEFRFDGGFPGILQAGAYDPKTDTAYANLASHVSDFKRPAEWDRDGVSYPVFRDDDELIDRIVQVLAHENVHRALHPPYTDDLWNAVSMFGLSSKDIDDEEKQRLQRKVDNDWEQYQEIGAWSGTPGISDQERRRMLALYGITLKADLLKAKGVNINDSKTPYTQMILDGKKTIETRQTNSLDPYVGDRVGIIRTGKGPAKLVGHMNIGKPKQYENAEQFDKDRPRHKVPKGSKEDKKGKSYGYPLSDVKRTKEKKVTSRGYVARDIGKSLIEARPRDNRGGYLSALESAWIIAKDSVSSGEYLLPTDKEIEEGMVAQNFNLTPHYKLPTAQGYTNTQANPNASTVVPTNVAYGYLPAMAKVPNADIGPTLEDMLMERLFRTSIHESMHQALDLVEPFMDQTAHEYGAYTGEFGPRFERGPPTARYSAMKRQLKDVGKTGSAEYLADMIDALHEYPEDMSFEERMANMTRLQNEQIGLWARENALQNMAEEAENEAWYNAVHGRND